MCGIAGFASLSSQSSDQLKSAGAAMHRALAHRGPDDAQVWVDDDANVMFAHRRLAIVDLSADGRQPMASASGRYMIVYNGEIYNYPALHDDLVAIGHVFKGRSDTEVLLAAIDHWGLNQTLQKINGQFAFALWDKKDRTLHLARDRFGKKPLYIGWVGDRLVFASELKAFHALEGFSASINEDAMALYMHYGYVCAPYSIYDAIWQLLPGSRMAIIPTSLTPGADLSPLMEKFWSLTERVEEARHHPYRGSEQEQIQSFETLLSDAVSSRMICDVPLGAFLSGGIDSSMVVAIMQKHSVSPVKTFSIAFDDPAYNEAPHAERIAAHLGTDHETLRVSESDAMGVIPLLPSIYDEPFSDMSAIPTYLVSKMARHKVTVALTGDGGDEILGGYDRHVHLPPLWNKIGWAPAMIRQPLAAALKGVPESQWRRISQDPQFVRKMHRLRTVIGQKDRRAVYDNLLAAWPDNIVLDGTVPSVPIRDGTSYPRGLNFADYMMFGDTLSYRVDDLMVKSDRASMAVALEARAPLMDYALCEFCWRLPFSSKIRDGKGKWLLRQVLKKYVPEPLFDRPKMGFGVPIAQWLRGDLREWANDLLSPSRLRRQGLFDDKAVTAMWQAHLRGEPVDPNGQKLWTVLMAQGWLDRWAA